MRKLTFPELVEALSKSGVSSGDVVHVQSDLRRIGPVDCPPHREGMLQFYLSAFQELLGRQGTLTVCTAFEDYGRYATPFIREESPSLTDAFSEYVRTRPGAVRSVHPIVSVTGIGARAGEICGDAHFDGFGYDSPWGRLHRVNARIMTLGMGTEHDGTTFFHYIESVYSVPYKYTKIFTAPVFSGGVEVPGPFTMSVRYLDFSIVNTPFRLKKRLVETGKAKNVPVGRSLIWCCPAFDIVEEAVERLREDRYYLLENPPRFRFGEIPLDGPTGPMQIVYDKGLSQTAGS